MNALADVQGGLPFSSNSFDVVLCEDVLEHVELASSMRELHRVLKPGGHLIIRAPHFTSRNSYLDPTHQRTFAAESFAFFCAGTRWSSRNYYFDFTFSCLAYSGIEFKKGRYLVLDRVVERLVNRSQRSRDLYELTAMARLLPAANVVSILVK